MTPDERMGYMGGKLVITKVGPTSIRVAFQGDAEIDLQIDPQLLKLPIPDSSDVAVDGGQLLYRVSEAAQALRVSRTTMFQLIKRGDLDSVLVGKSRRIPREALDEYIASL